MLLFFKGSLSSLIYTSEDGSDGLEKLKTIGADAVVLDLKMPKVGGFEFLKHAHTIENEPPIIILTGHGGVDEAVEAMKRGAYDFLTKPVNLDKLSLVLRRAIEEQNLKRRQIQLEEMVDERYGFKNIIGNSKTFQKVIQIVKQVAPTDASVLITGESGTGKEVIANSIHANSKRSKNQYIKVHCAALPETLLESELFGHEKGAFTGAIARKRGRFELADGGTIFLDEIGDLPLKLQAKLLRVIQQKSFEKVGSDTTIKVDVRILAATNRDIEALVEKGEFRSDLYYRLNVLPIYIPPLRQRPEDIPELANFFLKKFSRETKKQFDGFSDEAMEIMLSYSWPGNVRELENCIERACVISKDRWIKAEDLLLRNMQHNSAMSEQRNLKNALTVFKKHYIKKVLEENNWNQTEAAKALDIQRTYLSRLLKELDIVNPKE
jgi:Nif-specific regulatory protein